MEAINERFRKLRESCNKNQTEWAEILGLSRSGVSEIESGRRNVTDKHIKLLSVWGGVNGRQINEEWLRNGTGDMFRKPSDEVGYYVEELLEYEGNGNPFYDMIIEMMKTYHNLDEKSKTVIREYFKGVKKGLSEKSEAKRS